MTSTVAKVNVPAGGLPHEARATFVVWQREMIRFTHDRSRLVSSMVQPLLFLFVLGTGLASLVGASAPGFDFRTFLFPGVLATSVLFTAAFAGISMVWDREFGFLREMLHDDNALADLPPESVSHRCCARWRRPDQRPLCGRVLSPDCQIFTRFGTFTSVVKKALELNVAQRLEAEALRIFRAIPDLDVTTGLDLPTEPHADAVLRHAGNETRIAVEVKRG